MSNAGAVARPLFGRWLVGDGSGSPAYKLTTSTRRRTVAIPTISGSDKAARSNMNKPARRAAHSTGRTGRRWPEARIVAAVATLVGMLWSFVWLADEVLEGETHALDVRFLLLLRNPADASDPLGPVWLEQMARDFTGLGSVGVLTL